MGRSAREVSLSFGAARDSSHSRTKAQWPNTSYSVRSTNAHGRLEHAVRHQFATPLSHNSINQERWLPIDFHLSSIMLAKWDRVRLRIWLGAGGPSNPRPVP
ncbi:unnamed protein product, partial [Iphiclides podalirius]